MKEEIFSKFRDYNRELEKILEKKDFSKDTKNLLLSMFYKLEVSYQDYYTVKRKVKNKQEYLENILDNIKQCNQIDLVEPNDSQFQELKEGNLYEIDFKLKKIKVLANEFALLSSILELNNFAIHLSEEYNLIRNSIPYVLNTAYDMENLEVLRDFNAWSWNTLVTEMKDVPANLIYQTLKIALSFDIFQAIQKENSYTDVIEMIRQNLQDKYDDAVVNKFLNLIFKLSILLYISVSENEKKRLKEEKETMQMDLEEMSDKKTYIEKITGDKKNLVKELRKIDFILNDRNLLVEEYERRNQSPFEYNKVFSISHLVEKLQHDRRKILNKIEQCNQKIEPKNYVAQKNKLQEDYNLVKDIDFDKKITIEKEMYQLQKLFLQQIVLKKIEQANTKNELIDLVYELRYYNFLPYTVQKTIQEVEKLKPDLEKAKEQLIQKLYQEKLIITLSTNEKNDIEIVKNIFELRMINLEDVYLEIKKKEDYFLICIYDDKETLEREIQMNLEFNKKDKIRCNKKVKLFIS